MKRQMVLACGMSLAVVGFGVSRAVQARVFNPGPGQATLSAAAQKQQFVFLLFWKENNTATQAMQRALETALASRAEQAVVVTVQTTDPAEKSLVDQFAVSRSPMPLVVAVAPNGAVTGGFPLRITEQDVAKAFVSPGTAQCLKALQARKLVLLCAYPGDLPALPNGVREFQTDPQYGPVTELVALRATDPAEALLLKSLQIAPATAVPVTALFVPPGRVLGTFQGAIAKQQLIDLLANAGGACCPGGKCGPGGCCCPGGKCGPAK